MQCMPSLQRRRAADRTKRRSMPVPAWKRARLRRHFYSRPRAWLRRARPQVGFIAIIWRSSRVSRPPTHLVDRRAGAPVHGLAADDEALLLVKADCAGIVLVDVEVETLRRYAFCFCQQGGGDARSPSLRRHDDLIEIQTARIDGDESDHLTVRFRYGDGHRGDELGTPTLPPPFEPRREIDGRVDELPGPPPQLDRHVLVGGAVGAKDERQISHYLPDAWSRGSSQSGTLPGGSSRPRRHSNRSRIFSRSPLGQLELD